MPQFDVSTFPSQIFWLFLCFFIVYFYTSKVTLQRIKKVLEERWFETEGKKNQAEDFTYEASVLKAQYEEKLRGVKNKAHEHLTRAEKEAKAHTEQLRQETLNRLHHQYRQAEARTDKRRAQMFEKAQVESLSLSKDIVHCLTNNRPVRLGAAELGEERTS